MKEVGRGKKKNESKIAPMDPITPKKKPESKAEDAI
jgi:hypothetical protein